MKATTRQKQVSFRNRGADRGRCWKFAQPEQLRYWSDRARQVPNMRHAQILLWTRESQQHENLLTDAPPNEEDTDDGPNESVDESSASWEHDTCLVKRKTRPSSSSCLACPLGEARMSQQVYYNAREEHPRNPKNLKNKNHAQSSRVRRGLDSSKQVNCANGKSRRRTSKEL